MSKSTSAKTAKKAALKCPVCQKSVSADEIHGLHQYKDMKLKLDGYLKPGQAFYRNTLFDSLYASLPRDSQAQVQVYNYEIRPGGFTNWHIHTGATFYVTLEGQFEGHFQEGVLIEAGPGAVYSEPIGKIHRGHNPNAEVTLRGMGLALTTPGIEPIINVEPPAWAPKN